MRYGKDPSRALEMAQIPPTFPAANECPHHRLADGAPLRDAAMRELDDEALGWFSRRLPWGSYGMLVRASISRPHPARGPEPLVPPPRPDCPDITLTLSTAGDTASITLTENATGHRAHGHGAFAQVKEEPAKRAGDTEQKPCHWYAPPIPDPGPFREFCMVSVLRNVLGVACWLIDSRIALKGARLSVRAPPTRTPMPCCLAGPPASEKRSGHSFRRASTSAMPLRRDEKALQQMLQNALPLTVLQYRRDRLLGQQVRQLLSNHPQDTHSADASGRFAERVTPHLAPPAQGRRHDAASPQRRRAPCHKATELLLRSQRPIKQVAEAAGFQNEKALSAPSRAGPGRRRPNSGIGATARA